MHTIFKKSEKIIKTAFVLSIILLASACSDQIDRPDARGNFETDEIRISAQESGMLIHFIIKEGESYRKSEIVGLQDITLYHLNKEQIMAQIELVDFKKETYRSELSVLEAQLAPLLKDLERLETLFRSDAISRQELDHHEGRINVIRKQKEAVRLKEKSIQLEKSVLEKQILQIRDRINRCSIVNPVNGTVLTRFVQQGELVPAGRILYTISSMDTLILRAYISGNQLSSLQLGDTVTVLTDGLEKQQKHRGIIRWISSEAEFTPKQIQTREERVNLVYW